MAKSDMGASDAGNLTEESFSREGWLFEPKLDGERCLALRHGRAVDLFSRNQKRLNEKYPELVSALETQKSSTFRLASDVLHKSRQRKEVEQIDS